MIAEVDIAVRRAVKLVPCEACAVPATELELAATAAEVVEDMMVRGQGDRSIEA